MKFLSVFVSQQIFPKMHLNKYKLMNWIYLHELKLNISPTWKTQLGKKKAYLSNTFLVGMISMLIKLYCSWFKVVYLMNLFIPSGISHEPVYNQLTDFTLQASPCHGVLPARFLRSVLHGAATDFPVLSRRNKELIFHRTWRPSNYLPDLLSPWCFLQSAPKIKALAACKKQLVERPYHEEWRTRLAIISEKWTKHSVKSGTKCWTAMPLSVWCQ